MNTVVFKPATSYLKRGTSLNLAMINNRNDLFQLSITELEREFIYMDTQLRKIVTEAREKLSRKKNS